MSRWMGECVTPMGNSEKGDAVDWWRCSRQTETLRFAQGDTQAASLIGILSGIPTNVPRGTITNTPHVIPSSTPCVILRRSRRISSPTYLNHRENAHG
jgi:hypothetical protein